MPYTGQITYCTEHVDSCSEVPSDINTMSISCRSVQLGIHCILIMMDLVEVQLKGFELKKNPDPTLGKKQIRIKRNFYIIFFSFDIKVKISDM